MVDETKLDEIRQMLNYNDAQWESFMSNPHNLEVLERIPDFSKYRIVLEVTSSYGCSAGHKTGDRIIIEPSGALPQKGNPEKICLGLITQAWPNIWMISDKILHGQDPTTIAWPSGHCVDVGVDRGGWGDVNFTLKVEEI